MVHIILFAPTLANRNYIKLGKTTLITWVDKALNQSLIKQNMKLGFKVYGMRLLNPKAMEHRTRLSDIYITQTTSDNGEGEEDKNLDDEAKGNHQ